MFDRHDISKFLRLLESIDNSLQVLVGRESQKTSANLVQEVVNPKHVIQFHLALILFGDSREWRRLPKTRTFTAIILKMDHHNWRTGLYIGRDAVFEEIDNTALFAQALQMIIDGRMKVDQIGPKGRAELEKLFEGKLEKWIDSEHAGGYDEKSK